MLKVWMFKIWMISLWVLILSGLSLKAFANGSHRDDILEFNAGWVYSQHGNTTIWGFDYEHLNRTHSMGFALTYERESRSVCKSGGADLYALSYVYFIESWKLSAGVGQAHSDCMDSFLARAGLGYEFDLKEFEDIFVIPAVFVDHIFNQYEMSLTVGFGYRF